MVGYGLKNILWQCAGTPYRAEIPTREGAHDQGGRAHTAVSVNCREKE